MFLHKRINVISNAYVLEGGHSPPHEIPNAKKARTSGSKAITKVISDPPTAATNIDGR